MCIYVYITDGVSGSVRALAGFSVREIGSSNPDLFKPMTLKIDLVITQPGDRYL